MKSNYLDFLKSKIETAPVSGFDVDPAEICANLKPHQRDRGALGAERRSPRTVALRAMKLGRKGYTIELNNDYFRDAVGYLKAEEEEVDMPTLFDFVEAANG